MKDHNSSTALWKLVAFACKYYNASYHPRPPPSWDHMVLLSKCCSHDRIWADFTMIFVKKKNEENQWGKTDTKIVHVNIPSTSHLFPSIFHKLWFFKFSTVLVLLTTNFSSILDYLCHNHFVSPEWEFMTHDREVCTWVMWLTQRWLQWCTKILCSSRLLQLGNGHALGWWQWPMCTFSHQACCTIHYAGTIFTIQLSWDSIFCSPHVPFAQITSLLMETVTVHGITSAGNETCRWCQKLLENLLTVKVFTWAKDFSASLCWQRSVGNRGKVGAKLAMWTVL